MDNSDIHSIVSRYDYADKCVDHQSWKRVHPRSPTNATDSSVDR